MSSSQLSVEQTLRNLQALARRSATGKQEMPAMTFRLPAELVTTQARMLSMDRDEVTAMNAAAKALTTDLAFEHLRKPHDELQIFVAQAQADQGKDHVGAFLKQHERQILDLVCYLTVEYLSVVEETQLLQLRLLPLTDASIPRVAHGLSPDKPVGCVAAVDVRGTSYGKMAERARTTAEHALRVTRVGLREHNSVNDKQLRFRLGTAHAFSDQLAGWRSRSDVAYELEFGPHFADLVGRTPVWTLPAEPATTIDKKADIALRWMERARFTGEPLIALLYLFFALEALLGDTSEKLKADGLAFRQMMLSYIVTGEFAHPNTTWFLYDRVRSGAVHGENVPDIDEDTLRSFEWTVRDSLNQYLTLARDAGIRRRGKLLQMLSDHPDRPKLAEWVLENGGADWATYLNPKESNTGSL
jgi:hypothetical protein